MITNSEGHWRKLINLAMLAYGRYQVSSEDLSERLKLSVAAGFWALIGQVDGYAGGLFRDECGSVSDRLTGFISRVDDN